MYCAQLLEKHVISSSDVGSFFGTGHVKLFNNRQTDIPLPLNYLKQLYDEIPEDRCDELDAK